MGRLPNKTEIIKKLFALSGNLCAFPKCKTNLVSDKGRLFGQICHIEAANKEGERWNPLQTDEERRSFDNLILLCANHHIETNDVEKFTTPFLKKMKADHERNFLKHQYKIPHQYENEILFEVNEQLLKILDISIDTNSTIKRVEQILLSGSLADEETIYIKQLDSIKELKKQQKFQTVIDLLIDYRKNNWPRLSEDLKFKVIANLGITYLELHQNQKAGETFLEFKEIDHKKEGALSLLAFGCAILGKKDDFKIWFEKCKLVNEKNVNLWLAYIYVYQKGNLSKLRKEIPEELFKSPEILLKIGEAYVNGGKRAEGIRYLKKAQKLPIDSLEKLAEIKVLAATTIIKDIITPFKYLFNQFSDEEIKELTDAHKLFSEAWEQAKVTELRVSRWFILMNRGVISKILKPGEEAIQDLKTAYESSRKFNAFKNYVLTLIEYKKLDLAEQLMNNFKSDDIINTEDSFEFNCIKGRVFFLQHKTTEAINIFSVFFDKTQPEKHARVLIDIIGSLIEIEKLEEADLFCKQLKNDLPKNFDSYLLSGHIHFIRDEDDKAFKEYQIANSFLNKDSSELSVVQLGVAFFKLKKFDLAANLFEKVAMDGIDNEISRKLLYSYYQSGNIPQALRLSSILNKKFPGDSFFAEILMGVYYETNHILKAIEVFKNTQVLLDETQRNLFLLKGTHLYNETKDWESLREILLQIKIEDLDMLESFKIANFLLKSNEVEYALQLAFNSRDRFYEFGEAHTKYIWLLTESDKKNNNKLKTQIVSAESAVFLKSESGEEKIFIISNVDFKSGNTLRLDNPLARQLLGKQIGEEIKIELKYKISHTFLITEITHKYLYAFTESLKLFETKFALEDGITVLKANPGEANDEIFPFIKGLSLEHENFRKELVENYNKGVLPIGAFSQLMRLNVVKVWSNMLRTNDLFLQNYLVNEDVYIKNAVNSNAWIVIDITSLLTCFLILSEYKTLGNLKNPFLISQSTIDELQAFSDEMESHTEQGLNSLNFENGKMVYYSISKEDVSKQRDIIEKIIVWCKENASIQTSKKNLEINRNTRTHVSSLIGDCFNDSILLAQEFKATILSDDGVFKKLLYSEHQIPSFSSFQLAVYLHQRGLINLVQIEEISFEFILANNICIPVSADLLWKAFDFAHFEIKKPFTTAVKGLFILQVNFICMHVIQFFKKACLEIAISSIKEFAVLHILNELSTHKDFLIIKRTLLQILEVEFKLLQKAKDDISHLINTF